MTIPQMNRKLQEVNNFFTSQSKSFINKIQLHEGQFREQDFADFENLLHNIKQEAMQRIRRFFQQRHYYRSSAYETQINNYSQKGDVVRNQLQNFRQNLIKTTLETKQEQSRKQMLMEHFSEKLRKNLIMKKCLKLWKIYTRQQKQAKALDLKMDQLYRKNLLKKSFFPWRTLTYKEGYANTVQKQANEDIHHIQQQYQGIIQILKQKIKQTDEIIKVKKAAKGQFAYALSKNLLKTISNLSVQVMNLNQMSLRDGQWSKDNTHKFMQQVDTVIRQKLSKVRQYRQGLVEEGVIQQGQGQKKKKHISFA